MPTGNLAVVEQWLSAVNHADRGTLLALTDDNIEIVGPRGTGHGKELLVQWLARAGLTAEPERWFCGTNGTVVVEQIAHWRAAATSDAREVKPASEKRVMSCFVVRAKRVARFQRFDELEAALAAYGLRVEDEVSARQ